MTKDPETPTSRRKAGSPTHQTEGKEEVLLLDTPGVYIHSEIRIPHDDINSLSELPIVVMIHGFPQSSEMWRYVLERLPPSLPIYVMDVPGYGRSKLNVSKPYSKGEVGAVILDSLKVRLDEYPGRSCRRQKIILVGHDRGGRIAHRLSVDNNHPHFEIIGAAVLDIVPTLVQWESFSSPELAVGYYHWSFLSTPLAEDMIWAYGSAKWIEKGMGNVKNAEGKKRMEANLPYYKKYFSNRETLSAACADYRAGATVDCEEQRQDQKEGRKLKVPILAIYSGEYLGKYFDMYSVWKEWVDDEKLLRLKKMKDDIGHSMAEEDPDTVTDALLEWFREVLMVNV